MFSSPGVIECEGGGHTIRFEKWKFTKVEIPNKDISQMKVALEINMKSLRTTTDYTALERGIKKKKDWFNVKQYPTAQVLIEGAKKIEGNRYRAQAQLTLKGVTKKLPLEFSISEEMPYRVKGSFEMRRAKYGITGGGPSPVVPVRFEATLPTF